MLPIKQLFYFNGEFQNLVLTSAESIVPEVHQLSDDVFESLDEVRQGRHDVENSIICLAD